MAKSVLYPILLSVAAADIPVDSLVFAALDCFVSMVSAA
jgi:hypothetical protein